MNSKEKRAEIIELINNIKEHSDRLAERPIMPLLEVSAILSKINKLHESTAVLKFLLAKEQDHEEEFASDFFSPIEEQAISELEKNEDIQDDSMEDIQIEESDEEELIQEIDSKKISTDEDISQSKSPLQESKTIEDDLNENEIVNTLEEVDAESLEKEISDFKEFDGSDINEQYSQEEDNRLEGKYKNMNIEDILSSIGLNERYLYANDLFDGEMDIFKSEIQIINDFDSLSEAMEYWDNLKDKYNWELENTLVQALETLIERRYK